jgi:enoyl-CoA hydratase/carnithine racemase
VCCGRRQIPTAVCQSWAGARSGFDPYPAGHSRPPPAAQLFFFGEALDAASAERWGLVNSVFPDGELMDRTLERAEALAAKPARVVRLIKRLLTTPATSLRERADEELGLLAEQLDAGEAREAMQAFVERRRPDFSRFQ